MTVALILGGAPCVWEDLQRAAYLTARHDRIIIACNYAGIQFPGKIDAWVTFHHERFAEWKRERTALGYDTTYRSFVQSSCAPGDEAYPSKIDGSSGLYGAEIAIGVFNAKAILCGVPMDARGYHIHNPGYFNYRQYWPGMDRAKARYGDRIRSMSGVTMQTFGEPDIDWLDRPIDPV